MGDRRGFFEELKRRNVPRAAVLYAGAVWALAQGIAQLGPFFGAPGWVVRWFVIACVIGFPFWIAFAWFYQITLHGIRREPEGEAAPAATRALARRLDYWIIGILALAVVLLVTNTFVLHRDVNSEAAELNAKAIAAALAKVPAKSIAVLPFENLSADKKNEYFVAGMQDLILTKLADIGDLKVIARTSTQNYPSHPGNLQQIAAQLGVATLLEGSVQKAGQQVMINVQLIDAKTDAHIWAQAYTRNLDNIFGVEGEVAGKIATALKTKLTATQSAELAAVPTTNQAAYDLFLRAEFQLRRAKITFDPANFQAAIPLYRQAVGADQQFALAWARLSQAESFLAWLGGGGADVKQLIAQARHDAAQALKLAPHKPAPQIAVGYLEYYFGKNDDAAALQAFDAALALRPNDAEALLGRSFVETRQGHFDAAIASLQKAFALDPRNADTANELGATFAMLGRYTAAASWFRRAMALDPDSLGAQYNLAAVIVNSTGDVAGALKAAQGDTPGLMMKRVSLLTLQRNYRAAIALLRTVPNNIFYAFIPKRVRLANLYTLAGDSTRARRLFEQALPALRAQLPQRQGHHLAFLWYSIAATQLGLGHTTAALDAIRTSLQVMANVDDQFYGTWLMELDASAYARARRPDLAVPLLAKALATPGIGLRYSSTLLWLDPAWDPIRKDPRFQALLAKYVKYKPALTDGLPAPAMTR